MAELQQSQDSADSNARNRNTSNPTYTARQGQFLAFIHLYRKLHRQGPAELDMVKFFRVTPPTVHGMVVKLEELGLIARERGVARSIRVTIPEDLIPTLVGDGEPLVVQQDNKTQSKQKLRFPDRKISETFLHFAEPILSGLGPNMSEAQMERPLMVAFTVWNAVVYADAIGNSHFLDVVHDSTAHEPELAAFIGQLIIRKRSLFGDDHRLVGEYKLFRKDGEIRLRAEARDPSSSKRKG